MKPKDFKRWRKGLGLSQKSAAEALGLKRRVVQYYEKGERDGKDVGIPKTVRLACYALTEGVSDYHGPREAADRSGEPVLRVLTNGAAHEESTASLEPEAVKKPNKQAKAKGKEKDKGRQKGKDKDRAKHESAKL